MKLMEQQLHELGGLRVHIIPTDKYKTNTFVFRLKAPLNEETVTERLYCHMYCKVRQKSFLL